MARLRVPFGVVLTAAIFVATPTHAEEAPANPEAVAAYNEGMRQLEAIAARAGVAANDPAYAATETLFRKAAAADLPHAYYGLACAIFTTHPIERSDEAWELALYAAHRGVIEAQALVVNRIYQRVVSTQAMDDPRVADLMLRDLYRRADQPGLVSGAPGTVVIDSPADARRLIDTALGPGTCDSQAEKGAAWGLSTPPATVVEEIMRRTRWKKLPAAEPDAVAAYRRGMDLLSRPKGYVDFPQAEALFKRAADLGLPHAHFGMACLLYAQRDPARLGETLREMKLAADQQVLEAKALLAFFARFPENKLEPFNTLWEEVASLALDPKLVSGAPGTVTFNSPQDATRVVWDIAGTGYCAGGLYRRIIRYPHEIPDYLVDKPRKD